MHRCNFHRRILSKLVLTRPSYWTNALGEVVQPITPHPWYLYSKSNVNVFEFLQALIPGLDSMNNFSYRQIGMRILDLATFFSHTSNGFPQNMDDRAYWGNNFDCVCGKKHIFGPDINILRELPGMKIVISCEDRKGVTCVHIKGFFKPKFVSLFGSLNPENDEEGS